MYYAYLLVGFPGAGKSTFRKHLMRTHPLKNWVVVSADDYVDEQAKLLRKTYSEIFNEHRDASHAHALNQFRLAIKTRRSVIIDNTNLTKADRRKFMSEMPSTYRTTCVILREPNEDELKRRLSSRPGKTIPQDVLEAMRKKFEYPNKSEGFSEVYEWPQDEDPAIIARMRELLAQKVPLLNTK